MKTKLIVFMSLSILWLSSLSCVANPAQENEQNVSQPEIVNKREVAKAVVVVDGTIRPTRTPRTVEADGDTVELALNLDQTTHVILKLNQKLVIMPRWELGKDEWQVRTKHPEILSLDPNIDYTKPPKTGWVWTPHLTGTTIIAITEPLLACHKG